MVPKILAPILVFDIETIPDTDGLTKLYDLPPGTPAAEVAERAFAERREKTGSDFLPLHLQRVVAISCALRDRDTFKVWSLGTPQDNEATLIQRFFDGVEKYRPQLVSWNGGGFDLPVLHYRSLVNGVVAPRYWDMGEEDRDFKWNNYIGRYHTRHLDLMDLLALYQPRASAPLDALAKLCGFPGKLGMDGSKVWQAFQHGEIVAIRNYCETDVANTYLMFLRFQLMRGHATRDQHDQEVKLARETLSQMDGAHWREYLGAWK